MDPCPVCGAPWEKIRIIEFGSADEVEIIVQCTNPDCPTHI